jgi:hypothetical protein
MAGPSARADQDPGKVFPDGLAAGLEAGLAAGLEAGLGDGLGPGVTSDAIGPPSTTIV